LILAVAIGLWASPTLHALIYIEVAQLTHAGGSANDHFGWSVALDGNVAIVGDPKGADPQGNDRAGAASVFVHSGNTWIEAAQLVPTDGFAGDGFGGAVAISGNTIAVAAPTNGAHPEKEGVVYVFVRPGGGWSGTLNENARLENSGNGTPTSLGNLVAFSADDVVAGQPGLGSLFVFNKPVSGW
jgi:hypothetical protein